MRHLSNQGADLRRDGRARRLPARQPSPVIPEATPLPCDHGPRFDDDKGILPSGPDSREPRPEDSVGRPETGTDRAALADGELMAEGEDLDLQRSSGTEDGREEREQGVKDGCHGVDRPR